ncbi:NUDIX domain-containing protein [Rhizobium aethiopicum]|uniref:8-oxo-dGTP diphosphatase n=1 Tax=Rhizobium aethiopicum TaxID=1138170 RepID=A0A1C3XVG6_9HYPH|nr:NUDIX domain-containing protein [Rhizobium aethiopicum]SCB56267.1 NUDIX domain-containing protein [Rhizobium aethiopicum]
MPELAMGALTNNGSVLLARRSPWRRTHPDCWSLPGGHVEDGEDAEAAMRREMMEEIGVTPERWQFAAKFVRQGQSDASATFHIYRVDQWRGFPRLFGGEHTELRWFSAAAIECETELALPELGKFLTNLTVQQSSKN